MNFRTKIEIKKFENQINYSSKIISLGSCFAENMSDKFNYFKFQNSVNPFGIIFNPVSIENLIFRIVNNTKFTENDIFFHDDNWHCFEVHSSLSYPNKEVFLTNLNQILKDAKTKLEQATHIIITYGTSWIYRNKNSNNVVANCHKVPQNQFEKEILSIETIKKSIENSIHLIKNSNLNCNFIFTISPVRHLKDGFIENQRSKAHLISGFHQIIIDYTPRYSRENWNLNYFPSYEIMMDELRDYRFYKDDMLHPSQMAIDYIWEQFVKSALDQNAYLTMNEVDSIQKSLLHKPFNVNSERYLMFKEILQTKINNIQKTLPNIEF